MDFSLTEAERDLVGLCRDFAQNEIARRAPQAWEEARCPTDLLREMGELGLLGMLIPEDWGGIGMSTVGFVARSYWKIRKVSSDQMISPLEGHQPKLPV